MTRPGLVGIFNHVPAESPLDDGDRTHPSVCLRCLVRLVLARPRPSLFSLQGWCCGWRLRPATPFNFGGARPMELECSIRLRQAIWLPLGFCFKLRQSC
jgi:hypothetical protein